MSSILDSVTPVFGWNIVLIKRKAPDAGAFQMCNYVLRLL